MNKLGKKIAKPALAVMEHDWNLPHVTFTHNDLPVAKDHEIGKTHTMTMKARKVSENENGSTYKITHVDAAKGKKAKRYLLDKKTKN